jgi:hypothetical protein
MNSTPALKFVWTTPHDSHEGQLQSIAEAQEMLHQAADAPTMVEIFDPATGLAMAIGVGAAMSIVTFQETNDPPYFISLGDPEITGVLEFCYGNEPTEYLARNAVSNEAAQQALNWFIENRTCPTFFPWERL